jgi:hypothetical protein
VDFDAVGALRGKSHSQRDQLAVFSRDRSFIAADDLVESKPGIEFGGGKFAHLFKKPKIGGVMIVVAHVSPDKV